jgi:hypothetical protein
MIPGLAFQQYPQRWCWVFHSWNYPVLHHLLTVSQLFPSQHSTGPSPSNAPFGNIGAAAPRQRSETFCSGFVPEYYSPIRFLAPRQPEFRFRLYPNLPPGGFRSMFVFPVSHPFVCECHNISTIPSVWTIPGLPGSRTLLPHRVARTHLGTMDWNPTPSPP